MKSADAGGLRVRTVHSEVDSVFFVVLCCVCGGIESWRITMFKKRG